MTSPKFNAICHMHLRYRNLVWFLLYDIFLRKKFKLHKREGISQLAKIVDGRPVTLCSEKTLKGWKHPLFSTKTVLIRSNFSAIYFSLFLQVTHLNHPLARPKSLMVYFQFVVYFWYFSAFQTKLFTYSTYCKCSFHKHFVFLVFYDFFFLLIISLALIFG